MWGHMGMVQITYRSSSYTDVHDRLNTGDGEDKITYRVGSKLLFFIGGIWNGVLGGNVLLLRGCWGDFGKGNY